MFSLMEPRAFYRDFFDFRRDFDEMFHHLIAGWPTPWGYREYAPPVEAWTDQEAKKFFVRVALPGVDPLNVKVEVQGNMLTIAGSWKSADVPGEASICTVNLPTVTSSG